jgi:hypothetical protein
MWKNMAVAEPTQYSIELREATITLLKEQGIHEGLWSLAFEFSFGAGLMGVVPEQVRPGAIVQIQRLLARHPEGSPPNPHAVDAAKVNPSGSKSGSRRRNT